MLIPKLYYNYINEKQICLIVYSLLIPFNVGVRSEELTKHKEIFYFALTIKLRYTQPKKPLHCGFFFALWL